LNPLIATLTLMAERLGQAEGEDASLSVESILIVVAVMQRFRREVVADQPFELMPSITMRRRYGIKMIVHERPKPALNQRPS
jgi:hypothetical protein